MSHSGDDESQGGWAKNHRARLPGTKEIGYHSHGLHALEVWYLAKREKKSIAKLPDFSKYVEAIFFAPLPRKGETPPGGEG